MKFLHLADLHFGKVLHKHSLLEDQAYWVDQILAYIDETRPDAVVIAGDVYDRSVPSKEAVQLLSRFLTEIAGRDIPVLLTAGNHDGGERLEFAAELLSTRNVYIAGTPQKELQRVELQGVTFWLMPYVFPSAVRTLLDAEEGTISGFDDAVRALLEAQSIDFTKRNVLVAHQTVTAAGLYPERSGSESSIGGVGGIDCTAFDGFDYVALGHIHGAQPVGVEHIRYAGSPLCYHFSEAGQKKGPLLVTLGEKGTPPEYTTVSLPPLHPVRQIGPMKLEEVRAQEHASTLRNEYLRVVLTDEYVAAGTREELDALFSAHGSLLLEVTREVENRRMRSTSTAGDGTAEYREKTLDELFVDFYREQRGGDDPDEKEYALIRFAAAQQDRAEDIDLQKLIDELVAFALKQEEQA